MRSDFEETLCEIVDESLKAIFTEAATRIIYQHLAMNYDLQPENIAENVEVFEEGLRAFLSSGAQVIESIIIKRLYQHYNLDFENKEGFAFTDYVKELKQKI